MRELKKGSLGMLVLHLLNERPSYGYEICARLRERSGGTLSFEDAAIYPLLHDYERQHLVEGYWETGAETATCDDAAGSVPDQPSELRKGPRRRYYRLTDAGRAALRANIEEWNSFSVSVARVLGSATTGLAPR